MPLYIPLQMVCNTHYRWCVMVCSRGASSRFFVLLHFFCNALYILGALLGAETCGGIEHHFFQIWKKRFFCIFEGKVRVPWGRARFDFFLQKFGTDHSTARRFHFRPFRVMGEGMYACGYRPFSFSRPLASLKGDECPRRTRRRRKIFWVFFTKNRKLKVSKMSSARSTESIGEISEDFIEWIFLSGYLKFVIGFYIFQNFSKMVGYVSTFCYGSGWLHAACTCPSTWKYAALKKKCNNFIRLSSPYSTICFRYHFDSSVRFGTFLGT